MAFEEAKRVGANKGSAKPPDFLSEAGFKQAFRDFGLLSGYMLCEGIQEQRRTGAQKSVVESTSGQTCPP